MLFSTAAMSIVTVITLVTTIGAIQNQSIDKSQIIIRFVTAAVMLVSMLIIPVIRIITMKKSKKRKEDKRRDGPAVCGLFFKVIGDSGSGSNYRHVYQ